MKQSERALVAACGGYCGGCLDYLVYISNDDELKKKLAEEISKDLGMDLKPEDIGCLGCHGSIHKPWCASCSLQRCTEEKAILSCAFCDEYPCQKVGEFHDRAEKKGKSSENIARRRHILRQREIGLEKWLAEAKQEAKIGK